MKTVVVSDIHANSTVALCPPSVQLEDGGTYTPNKLQLYLWDKWVDFVDRVPKGSLVVVNGDLIHGANAMKDTQIISSNKAVMRDIAYKCIEPLAKKAGEIYFVRGTEWHESTGAQDLETVARGFRNTVVNDSGQYSSWELWIELYGKVFHFTHHVGMGVGSLAKEMQDAVSSFVLNGQTLPDVMIRSHKHLTSSYTDGRRHIFVTPAWQAKTAFLVKIKPMMTSDIGGIIYNGSKSGEITWQTILYSLPKPNVTQSQLMQK